MPMPPPLPSTTDVLIIGAGPTGLVCAITLAREGQQVVIVDASDTNANGCRAFSMHANTLEVLSTIDCADPIVERSIKLDEWCIYDGTTRRFGVPISKILQDKFHIQYPYYCSLPQNETERLLREKLSDQGVEVIRGKRLVAYTEAGDGIEVGFEDGTKIRTKYLVGADGSRSSVRTLAGIAFNDPNTGEPHYSPGASSANRSFYIILADVKVTGYIPESSGHSRFAIQKVKDRSFILVPFAPSKFASDSEGECSTLYRFGTVFREGDPVPPGALDRAYIQALMDHINPWPERIVIDEVYTASRYRAKAAIASSFFRSLESGGKILLAGDAAHMHSPFGGQGMNLGICDGVALGHAISSHIQKAGEEGDGVLESFAERRLAVARRVVGLAKTLESMSSTKRPNRWFWNAAMYFMWRIPWLQQWMAWRISGLVNRE